MIKSLALGALLSLAAVAAQAATVSVELQKPVAKADAFITNGVAFDCTGAACSTDLAQNDTYSVDTCHQLAKQVGPIAAFTSVKGSFDSAKLAKCNAGIGGMAAQSAQAPAPNGR